MHGRVRLDLRDPLGDPRSRVVLPDGRRLPARLPMSVWNRVGSTGRAVGPVRGADWVQLSLQGPSLRGAECHRHRVQ